MKILLFSLLLVSVQLPTVAQNLPPDCLPEATPTPSPTYTPIPPTFGPAATPTPLPTPEPTPTEQLPVPGLWFIDPELAPTAEELEEQCLPPTPAAQGSSAGGGRFIAPLAGLAGLGALLGGLTLGGGDNDASEAVQPPQKPSERPETPQPIPEPATVLGAAAFAGILGVKKWLS